MDPHRSRPNFAPPKNVIIIGGSLSSLMHGIMLHRLGSTVRVLEQSPTETPKSHMAGVCLGAEVLSLLQQFDKVSEIPLGIPSLLLQSLDQHGIAHPFLRVHRIMSSWDALYFRLRANFDGLASDYVPQPPAPQPVEGETIEDAHGRAKYEVGKQVASVEQLQTGQLLVSYTDHLDGGKQVQSLADLVIGADGPNSIVRRIFLGRGQADRKYAGYVAWRGVVPEEEVSAETREIFRANITYSLLSRGGGHVIVYYIPGERGSVEPGKRVLNFCWYLNFSSADLDKIMTDVDGVRHHTQVAPGMVDPKVWAEQVAFARTLFAAPYLEVLDKIPSPFLHLITDYRSPRASFAGGKVLLVGDAFSLLRPHIAFSTNQAAYHAQLTEKLVKGEITTERWEYQVTKASYLHWRRSVWFGEYFQRPLCVSLGSAVKYWFTAALSKVRVWIGWLPKQTL